MADITQERLKELLNYNEDTGVFTNLTCRQRARPGDVSGSISGKGYRQIYVDGKSYQGHRLAWLYVYGSFPAGSIDHRDRDKLNNRICNLRDVSHAVNMKNMTKYRNNKSGTTGVYWNKSKMSWEAAAGVDGRIKYLGRYKDKDYAILARLCGELLANFTDTHGE